MSDSNSNRFIAIVSCYIVFAVVYSVLTPVFEPPDEHWHYAYVRYLVNERTLPHWEAGSPLGQQASQPPLYYVAAAFFTGWVPDTLPVEYFLRSNPFWCSSTDVDNNQNRLIHTVSEDFPWHGTVLAVHLARFVSLLFGCAAVAGTWLLAGELLPGRNRLRRMVTLVVAFTPQFLFISGAVSNDAALVGFSTLALWLLMRGVRWGFRFRLMCWLGLTVGLATLSKPSALVLVPLVALALLADVWLHRAEPGSFRTRVAYGLVFLFFVLVVSGWWYGRSAMLYGDPLSVGGHLQSGWVHERPSSLVSTIARLPEVEITYWAAFGWGNLRWPGGVYDVLRGLSRLACLGVLIWGVRRFRTHGLQILHTRQAVMMSLLLVWALLILGALLRWMQILEAALGRLLFPAIASISVLLVLGLAQLPYKIGSWCSRLLATYLMVLSFLTPWLVIGPAYALPSTIDPSSPPTPHRVDLGFTDGAGTVVARVLGYDVTPGVVSPGETADVTVCWEAVSLLDEDYAVFVQFIGDGQRVVAQRDTYPGLGRFPTSRWRPADAFCDHYALVVSQEAPAPYVYDIQVGLYSLEDGRRLPVMVLGQPSGIAWLGRIKVTPEHWPPAYVSRPLHRDFGGQIALLGYEMTSLRVQPGGIVSYDLVWHAQRRPDADYTVFAHLRPVPRQWVSATAAALPVISGGDGPPLGGHYPTTYWAPGETLVDKRQLVVSDDLPVGRYALTIGLYRLDTMERLLLPDGDSEVTLPVEIEVVPGK